LTFGINSGIILYKLRIERYMTDTSNTPYLTISTATRASSHATRPVRPHLQKAIDSGDAQRVIDCLTDKQKSFVEEYMKDLNGSEAVKRCGYNTKNPNRIASELLRNPGVRFSIDALKDQRTKHSDVTSDYVLKEIHHIVEKTKDGNPSAALRGLELLAKHLGMFVERQEITGKDGGAIEYNQKVEQDAASLEGAIARLANRGGKTGVDVVPLTGTKG
jgi:phage terminase small subunit